MRVAGSAFELDDWRLWALLVVVEAERGDRRRAVALRDELRRVPGGAPPPRAVVRALAERLAEADERRRGLLDW